MSALRRDPISGRWVLIAPEFENRMRPWIVVDPEDWSEGCTLCEGREGMTPKEIYSIRKGGSLPDTPGWSVRVIPFHSPFLAIETALDRHGVGIYDEQGGRGAHEIVVESTSHDVVFHEMDDDHVSEVLEVMRQRLKDLFKDRRFRTVFISKSSDFSAGALFSHPHFQIIAAPVIPSHIYREIKQAHQHFEQKDRCIFCDILLQERESGERMVVENGRFLAFTPFASRFPYELIIFPKAHSASFASATRDDIDSLTRILKEVIRRLDILYPGFSYNLSFHISPNRDSWDIPDEMVNGMDNFYHWHISIVPRIYRHMGFEWHVGLFVNPIEPETAALRMREIGPQIP